MLCIRAYLYNLLINYVFFIFTLLHTDLPWFTETEQLLPKPDSVVQEIISLHLYKVSLASMLLFFHLYDAISFQQENYTAANFHPSMHTITQIAHSARRALTIVY